MCVLIIVCYLVYRMAIEESIMERVNFAEKGKDFSVMNYWVKLLESDITYYYLTHICFR